MHCVYNIYVIIVIMVKKLLNNCVYNIYVIIVIMVKKLLNNVKTGLIRPLLKQNIG